MSNDFTIIYKILKMIQKGLELTIKGLEYLEENSFMKKAKELIGNVASFI